MAYTHIEPGREIEVSAHIYRSTDKTRVAELVTLPLHELSEREQASVTKEREIFEKFKAVEAEWTAQAAETVSLREALTYRRVRPVEHTSNQWKAGNYDLHEISNTVYKMTYRIYEQTRYDRSAEKSVIVAWELSWYLSYNTVQHPDPDLTGSGWRIAGQDKKRFVKKEDMEKYLQGRIAAYAHLFTELSPPVPKEAERRFCVNGVLLPGYTVEAPERTPQEVAGDLLAFLDEEDIGKADTKSDKMQSTTAAAPQKTGPKRAAQPKQKHLSRTR